LPENLQVRGLRLKVLLKSLLATKVPGSMVSRRKEGLDIPVHAWLRGPLRGLLLDTLAPRRVRASGIFSPAMVQNLIQDHLEKRVNVGYHLWGLMTLFLWLDRWGIGTSSNLRSASAPVDESSEMELSETTNSRTA
jgi:asparagine synthase (glutamine-hydrolysing)